MKAHIINQSREKGFTLIELLIVIAVLVVLAGVVLFALNPAEILKKGRDGQRLSDLGTIQSAFTMYLSDTSSPSMGTADKIYHSKVGTTAGDDIYPTDISAAKKVDGTGWIPVNFSTMVLGSPLSALPVDPKNADSYEYRYGAAGGAGTTYELDTALESKVYTDAGAGENKHSTDGGSNNSKYEIGTDLNILDPA